MFSRTSFFLGFFLLHLLLVFDVCCRDTFYVLAQSRTILPDHLTDFWRRAEEVSSRALGQHLNAANPVHEALDCYLHSAGIEGGYGFFAPNVPNSYKVVFEVHYEDGRVEYELPQVSDPATGLRLASLLDYIGHTRYAALRELMVKMLAYSVWREHPDAKMIRAVIGFVILPTALEFANGKKESYEFLYAYDFSFHSPAIKPSGL